MVYLLIRMEPQDLKNHVILGSGPSAPLGQDEGAAASSSASASSSKEPPPIDWADYKKRRILKAKMPVLPRRSAYGDDDGTCAAATRRPARSGASNKLMGDAIRSHGRATHSKLCKTKSKQCTEFWCGMGCDGQSTSSAGSDLDYSFNNIKIVSDKLRGILGGLGAVPVRVYGRKMAWCDRDIHQSRLQISCKRFVSRHEFPLSAFLTNEEYEAAGDWEIKEAAEGKADKKECKGLVLQAYDRDGNQYMMTFKYYESNQCYRFTKEWCSFLRKHGLNLSKNKPGAPKDVMIDLWLFRQPGGKVQMVVLHYDKGDAVHADAALDEGASRRLGNATAEASAPLDGVTSGDGIVMEEIEIGGEVNEEGGGARVKGEMAAALFSAKPDCGANAVEEQQTGVPGETAGVVSEEVVATQSSTEADGGSKMGDKHAGATATLGNVPAPLALSSEARRTKTTQEEAGASATMDTGGTPAVVDQEAGGTQVEVVVPASSTDAGGAMEATEGQGARAKAGPPSCRLTELELSAAHALVQLSKTKKLY
ncbi:hypothetical protein BS78_09G110100 [Paspalum vaginatum]|nr:hypothetical protein BS78_09G110100 [Paspalum vaginatum]